jgi:hypothetical protein
MPFINICEVDVYLLLDELLSRCLPSPIIEVRLIWFTLLELGDFAFPLWLRLRFFRWLHIPSPRSTPISP